MTNDELNKLRGYLELSSDEHSEACGLMVSLMSYASLLDDKLVECIAKELKEALEWFEENTRIIQKQEVITRNFMELEYTFIKDD